MSDDEDGDSNRRMSEGSKAAKGRYGEKTIVDPNDQLAFKTAIRLARTEVFHASKFPEKDELAFGDLFKYGRFHCEPPVL